MKNLLIVKLLAAVLMGLLLGAYANIGVMTVVITLKHIVGQIIFFSIPLVVFGFITPAITKMRSNASKMLIAMLLLAYFSSIGAAFFSMFLGYNIIPFLQIPNQMTTANVLPALLFKLDIPPVFSVMTALVGAIFIGLAAIWSKAEQLMAWLEDINKMVLALVQRIIVPILPVFILCTFAVLAYEGEVLHLFPVFISVICIAIAGHFIWLLLLYMIGALMSGKNPLPLLRSYIPAYLTAVGTMSSAATLPVALQSARNSGILKEEITSFAIPLGATIHLCGSVLTEVFFVMTVSQVVYGSLPELGTMVLFIFLLGIFAIGAPGVPGGTVMASLGLITQVLGFDETGIALMLTIFALQDSFGTACNIVGDGALALIMQGLFPFSNKSA